MSFKIWDLILVISSSYKQTTLKSLYVVNYYLKGATERKRSALATC
jgi:hypothetical protein